MTWTRLISITGIVLDEQPIHHNEGEEEEEEKKIYYAAALEEAAELAKKLRKLVCAAVCADKRVPIDKAMAEDKPPYLWHIADAEQRRLELLQWKLEQKEALLRALEQEESDKPYDPGPMSFRCLRWMRTDKDVLACRASCRQGAVLVHAMESLLWGEKSPTARQLRAPLAGIWRKTFSGLSKVGWMPGPRQWRRDLLQVIPTGKEISNIPRLEPKPEPDPPEDEDLIPPLGALAATHKHRVFCVTPVINAAPFDADALAGTLRIEGGGTIVKGRIQGVEAFMTMTARTAVPIQALGAPMGKQTCAVLHYFEVKIVGNVFGMAIGLVAGAVSFLDTWFPDDSLRLEFDGAIRGKGMFEPVPRNGDDPDQVFRDGDTVGVLFDILACQLAWYVNGKLLAHRCHLPLGHHQARDLRFMVAVRGAQVEMTPAGALIYSHPPHHPNLPGLFLLLTLLPFRCCLDHSYHFASMNYLTIILDLFLHYCWLLDRNGCQEFGKECRLRRVACAEQS
jgi:hypothetical protein